MAFKVKTGVDTDTSIPLDRVATPRQLSSLINKRINASQYEYHESEAFVVREVILNEPGNRDSVRGSFINNPNQEVLGGVVKSENPLQVAVPVVGEHVVVVERNGQHYYTGIINRKGSINENSIPIDLPINTKYGETFERKKVKPLEIGEGCVLFEGRFGQSVHFDSHNNVPSIKLRTNIDTSDGEFTTENIDTDDSSIYLISDGLRGTKFDGQQVKGKKILIKSDGIFIKGNDIRLGSGVEKDVQPVVRGNDLKELLDPVFAAQIEVNKILIKVNLAKIATLAAVQPPTKQTVDEINETNDANVELAEQNKRLDDAIKNSTYLSDTVKTI